MAAATSLRATWEPRMLSITRIMIGLLFLGHGTAKLFDFPHQPTHQSWILSSLNPGITAAALIAVMFGLKMVTKFVEPLS